jgi:N-methylhydantoinase B/oxoprolinase/acetone carboxylase alpha subunit
MRTLDAFRVEILSNALAALTEEIQVTLLRSAYSQVVKEAQDASCAIFTDTGRIVAQPVVIPGHLGSMKFLLLEILADFPPETLQPGDVLISNHPYRGGSHLPDIGLFRPVFVGRDLLGFAGTIIHYTDVGGMVPGSNPARATELYQEGLVIPPAKLFDAGRENTTLRNIIRENVRRPDIFFGDLMAQDAALRKGEQRLLDLAKTYGVQAIRQAMQNLIDNTERQCRAAIAAIPNGSYAFVDYMDHDGIDLKTPVLLKVRLDVLDDRLRFDFSGSHPQVPGPVNAPISKTWTTVFFCVRCILPDDIAFNDGLTSIIEIFVPEGTVLNPRHPAPVNARSITVNRLADVVLGALAMAVPEKVGAQSCGVPTGVSFGGIDPRTGESFIFYESYGGGMGGTRHLDGASAVSTGTSNAMNIPVEAVELDYPLRITRYELVPGSAGDGAYRGGLGLLREYEMLAADASVNVRGDRMLFCPRGTEGGGDAAPSAYFLDEKALPSKYSDRIKLGQRLKIITPGGGGFGNPHDRDRAAVQADLTEGKISAQVAASIYGLE